METSVMSTDAPVLSHTKACVMFEVADDAAAINQLQMYLEERRINPNWRREEAKARHDAYAAYPGPGTRATKTIAAEATTWLDVASVPPMRMTPERYVLRQTTWIADLFALDEVPSAYMALTFFADRYCHC